MRFIAPGSPPPRISHQMEFCAGTGFEWKIESAEPEYATGRRRFPLAKNEVRAVSGLSGGLEGDMPRKNDSESSEPLADGRDRRTPVQRWRRL